MNQQPTRQSVFHQALSILTRNATGQGKQQVQAPKRPIRNAWPAYWEAMGQPWRTEPEINSRRQRFLTQRRNITPDLKKGIYPFKNVKLDRADIEWLLATHEDGRGPVDWSDESQRTREGLDLRGADLREVNLMALPLTRMIGGFDRIGGTERGETSEKAKLAAIHLEEANLTFAHLEGAYLMCGHLEGAFLVKANLEEANLVWADLQGTYLLETDLKRAHLTQAHLEGAYLNEANLDGANLIQAYLEKTNLCNAHLEKAHILQAHLEKAFLLQAHLEGSDLRHAHLEGTILGGAHLEGANLSGCFFDGVTNLHSIVLSDKQHGNISLADIHWGDINVTAIDWSVLSALGDEHTAIKQVKDNGDRKTKQERLDDYKTAVRGYRQLAAVLQNQGLNEDAARFAYRAQVLQKTVLHHQIIQADVSFRKRLQLLSTWLFSWFLFLLAGYGYRPLRSFFAYLFVIIGFAISYYLLGVHDVVGPHHVFGPHYLTWYEAIVVSMTAFHGRGFFANQFQPGDPQAFVAAFEAFVGLLIEVTFIATLTKRLFGQ